MGFQYLEAAQIIYFDVCKTDVSKRSLAELWVCGLCYYSCQGERFELQEEKADRNPRDLAFIWKNVEKSLLASSVLLMLRLFFSERP